MADILVVDDHAINREFLNILLSYAGHAVTEAGDGAEGLAKARASPPQLIISDIFMPVMDGIEFARQLHADPALAHIPVIFYTATYRLPEARAMGQSCGVTTVLAKPSDPQLIIDTVTKKLGQTASAPAVLPPLPTPEGKTSDQLADKLSAYLSDLNALQQQLQLTVERSLTLLEEGAIQRITADVAESLQLVQKLGLRLSVLIELGLALSSERDPEQLVELFCRAAQDVMNARYAAIWLVGADGRVTSHASRGYTDAAQIGLTTLSGLLAEVLATAVPLRKKVQADNFTQLGLPATHPPIQSVMAVPIKSGAKPYGVLCLADRLGDTRYDLDDERIAVTLASQFSLAHENLDLLEESRESESRFRQLAENIDEVFFLLDADYTRILYVSPGYEEIWGRSCESLYAEPRSWSEAIHPDDMQMMHAGNAARDENGWSEFDFECRIVRPDGAIRWIHARSYPVLNDAGELFRIAGIAEDITLRKQSEQALQESQQQLHGVVTSAMDAIVIVDEDQHIVYANPSAEKMFGYTASELQGQPLDMLIPHRFRTGHSADIVAFGKSGVTSRKMGDLSAVSGLRKNGEEMPIEASISQNVSAGRRLFTAILRDITERVKSDERIRRLNRIYTVLSGINSAIVRIHDRNELFHEACRIVVDEGAFGLAWVGMVDPDTLKGGVVAWCGGKADSAKETRLSAQAGEPESERPACVALREKRPVICNDIGTQLMPVSLRKELLAQGHQSTAAFPLLVENRVVGVLALFAGVIDFFDEDELRLLNELAGDLSFGMQYIAKETQLSYLAYFDVLTGLPNGALFHDRLTQLLHGARGNHRVVAVIMVDVVRFAQVNEVLGRHVGDMLLRQVAERFNAALRDPYTLARISSDTFAIAVGELRQGENAASILEERIFQSLDPPFMLDQQAIRVSARGGVAVFPEDGADADTLFKHAEIALKKAKASNERYLYFAPQMNEAVAARMTLENELRLALEADQFTVYYQPRVDLSNGRIVSAEALIRWQHPQHGLVSPVQFIPLAEETGLIVPIGAWMIHAVCAQQAAWLAQQLAIVPVAINLSSVQFKRSNVLQTIHDAIEQHQLQQHYIEFELTESVVMENPEEAIRKLQALKQLGVKLSLDDFGTGYSSLAYLKRFPFDFVKIDRAFVTDITTSQQDAALADAIIAMSHGLNLRVVAEGVETEGQLNYLREQGCDELQGYYFSPPVTADAFAAMLREGKRLVLAAE